MPQFLVRLMIVILVIVLTQFVLTELKLRDSYARLISVVVLLFSIAWLLFGYRLFPLT